MPYSQKNPRLFLLRVHIVIVPTNEQSLTSEQLSLVSKEQFFLQGTSK